MNKRIAYFDINRSRGRKIVRETLTDKFKGVLISDFYGVYFNLPYRKQKCLVHLLRGFSKFWLDMFTFLQDPTIAWNNNMAERMIRPNVIYRNRSFGNRSMQGAKAHATMMSMIQTLILQKQNVGNFLKTAYIAHRQGDIASRLAPIILAN